MTIRARAAVAAALFTAALLSAETAQAQALPVGPSVQQYTGHTRWPAVAYDSEYGVYLVVWGNGTIRGMFVNDDGTPASAVFQVSDPSVNAQTPRLAYSSDTAQFLVVWHSSDGVSGNPDGTRVRGRLVDFTYAGPVGSTQVYSNGDYTTRWEVGPGVAYSEGSQQFLVAYNIFAATGAEVAARLVDTTGAPVGAEIAVTASTGDYDREPAVGYFPSTNAFAVAWSGSGASADYIRVRMYGAADGVAAGPAVTVAQATYTYVPDLAYNTATGAMLLAWIQIDPASGAWRPFGNFLDDAGVVVGTTRRLSSTVGSYDANSVAYNAPAMTFFLVTHGSTEQDVGFEISGDGTPVSAAMVVTSVTAPNLTGCFNPRIGASSQSPNWLVATAASFSSLWTQVITGVDLGGGTGTVVPKLTITPVPAGGTVTGGGLTCGTGGTTCQVTFAETTSVTLTATPDAGFTFTSWGGSCSGTEPTVTLSVSSAKTCRATFVQGWTGPGTQPVGCLAAPSLAYPAAPGPIGSSVNQYSGATQYPDVAYSACQQVYLAVWSLGGSIRGRFIGEDGAGVGNVFYISTGQFAQTPKVTYNPNLGTFLVAWHSSASDTRTELRSAVVTYPPGPASEGRVLSASTYSTRWITRPAVSYAPGSGRYLVGWSRYASTGAEISARMLDALGEAAAGEFAVTASAGEYDREPTVGYLPDANRFLLAWAGSADGSPDFVRGQMYDASTGAASGSPLAFGQATFTYVPEAALNATTGHLFVVWMQTDPMGGGWRPFGRFVDGNGTFLSPSAIRLSATEGAYDANSIAYNALTQSFFLVTHGSSTLQDVGFEIAGDGTPLGTAAPVTSITQTNFIGAFNPRVAASEWQPRFLAGTAASFNSLWTQLVGGRNPGVSLTISPAPKGGTVTGGAIACGTGGTACQQLFEDATTASLTATADSGYLFTGWGGSCTGTTATTTVLVDGARICTAFFTAATLPAPVVTIAASDTTATEVPLNHGAFTISRTGDTAAALTVGWTITGAATPASGDILPLPTTVTIPAGAASATVLVTPVADGLPEPPETVIATLTAGTGYAVGATSAATLTIRDYTSDGDFTADLKADILWHHAANGQTWLWQMDGPSQLSETLVGTVADTAWEIRAVADLSGDGASDIVWRNRTTGAVYGWSMNGAAVAGESYVGSVDAAYDIVSSGDYDRDGKADLLWRHRTTGDLWLWSMNGAVVTDSRYLGAVDPAYVVEASGDLNGDGFCDIVWRHASLGDVWTWFSNGVGFPDQSFVARVADTGYQIDAVADLSGDGRSDILWRHATSGDVWLWVMDGVNRTSESWVATVADTSYVIASAGDYNADRKADILWWNSSTGAVWVWLMDGPLRTAQVWVGTVPDTDYRIVR